MNRNATFTKSFVRKPGHRGDTSIPIRSEAPPPLRHPAHVARAKTLTRPERSQPQVPLINPTQNATGFSNASKGRDGSSVWTYFSMIVTFWAPAPLLSSCAGLKDGPSRQAWREKVALVFIALLLGGCIGFITMGLTKVLCPTSDTISAASYVRIGTGGAMISVQGWEFNISAASQLPVEDQLNTQLFALAKAQSGSDITPLFSSAMQTNYPSCASQRGAYAQPAVCTYLNNTLAQNCPMGTLDAKTLSSYGMVNTTRGVGYAWEDIDSGNFTNYMILDGVVLNLNPYLVANPRPISGDVVDIAIREQLSPDSGGGGRDATMMFYSDPETRKAIRCLKEKYRAGGIDKITPGCFISNLVLYCALITILGIVMIRFAMAVWFSWFMSAKMAQPPRDGGRRHISPNMLPVGAMTNVNEAGAAPWAGKQRPPPSKLVRRGSGVSLAASIPESLALDSIGSEPYVVCLVTCYSENEEGISTTLTSLAGTDYSDSRKLLFVVADGMVTGSGESVSTPDVCVGLLDADPRFGTPIPMSFISVADGRKKHNMAMVYAGHYTRAEGHRTPMVVVVKCGTPEEAKDGKPGNRGKRDSQMILMNFFQRVTYNDRMTPLDYDLFRKLHTLMGVTPDFFELCLMVDADTMVYPKSMTVLANVMMKDHLVMGACGETRIANKTQSWITMIQVYEYFISHHQAKAFESVFGGVTCLPGCFSMYRIKARKPRDDDWVPIIVKPEVTREYSQSTVGTLHQKNLLLLGEDRFLTTMLLRTFPNRKMVFCPEARCRTEVPHTFKMLLSQRRRWINSTVHNLMELVLVRDLCGTFCFSMQFVVFMDLLGTATLPVALALTYTLAINFIINPPHNFTEAIPLMLLVAVIGMPAVLILLATRKVIYVLWMLVYLVALPVWNMILPLYAFWHFDDFSWGETRKVEGEGKDTGHGAADGVFEASSVALRRWEEWERSRLKKQKREERRRRDLEKQFGQGFYNDSSDSGDHDRKQPGVPLATSLRPDSDAFSDTASDFEEDRWGAEIGGYDETAPPPPTTIVRHSMWMGEGTNTLNQHDMEAMLSQGWEERGAPPRPSAVANRGGHDGRSGGGNDPPVPKIPSRFGQNQGYYPGQIEMERTPSRGEYASLMRGSSQPNSPSYAPVGFGSGGGGGGGGGPGYGPGGYALMPGSPRMAGYDGGVGGATRAPVGRSSAVNGRGVSTHARDRSQGQ
ncbi:Chitin synthase, class 7 [Thecaphora frezii]